MSVLDQTSHWVFRPTEAKVLYADLFWGQEENMLADRTFRVRKMLKYCHLAYTNYVFRVRGQAIPLQVALAKENTIMPSIT